MALAGLLAACGAKGGSDPTGAGPDPVQAQNGYLAPPVVTAVSAAQNGASVINGASGPGARIRAVTAEGKAYGATAGDDGHFALTIPRAAEPELLWLSTQGDRRSVEAEGWLFVPPDAPTRAVVLRPGAPARPLNTTAGLIAAVDFDGAGGAAVAGMAAPGAEVSIALDGGRPVAVRADARGAFGARFGLSSRIGPGLHSVSVSSGGRSLQRSLEFAATAPAKTYSFERRPEGWRVAWIPPGTPASTPSAAQTTLVLVGNPGS